ncbi:MAG TPA: hypothetical protein VEW28_00845 [Candidatus Kapabacteria bacterium]|nr:hypothetical protein [Candidatus Kapabacteria bacterium]
MTILLSTIIMNLTMLFGYTPTTTQVNAAVAADQQAGIIVVADTLEVN